MTTPKSTPAAELRAIRSRLGLTQVEFAARLGVAPNSVARYERGERRPGAPVVRLARRIAAERGD